MDNKSDSSTVQENKYPCKNHYRYHITKNEIDESLYMRKPKIEDVSGLKTKDSNLSQNTIPSFLQSFNFSK